MNFVTLVPPMKLRAFAPGIFAGLLAGMTLRADEGMWLFSAPPKEQIQAKYGFEVTDAWLEHLMKSSVRFNSGGSGSFVSGDGLVITNHHVGADSLQKMGSKDHDYLRDGFYAKSAAEEIKSMGAKAIELDLETLEGAGGYAREMTEDRAARQMELLAPYVAAADALITTAAVPGRTAPRLVTAAMVEAMKPGSVVVDLAAETGGPGIDPIFSQNFLTIAEL